ncbi:tRNA(adenine(34)) deaminase, chloroplastic [Phragmites australis]|uniref:tRNA(adenine(34)) deaminase, chloroplastic n=1 Tax=Phragmites australis TaxID=29695 RepID=UPI002D7763B1|nr:tRNA(adenine(34)) deaminase, chloroplastic [Phragmites australis]
MYSSYSAATFALRAAKPSLHAHSSYSYSYLPSYHCHRDDADGHHHHHHHELLPPSPFLNPRFLLDGCLLRHSTHLLLLSARLQPPAPPPHPYPPRCCRRRAAARCCSGGSGRPLVGQVSWRVEARGCQCCRRGAARSDLGGVCRRLEARGFCCGGSGGGRLLGASCGRRDARRLVGTAVRQEVWEYDGEWPHRRCSMECHDDWEEEEDESGRGQWEIAGRVRLGRSRWEDDDVDDDNHDRCRDCHRRKGMKSSYNCEDGYSGRQREKMDVIDGHGNFRESDQRRRQQSEYQDDEDNLDLRRRRQRWEGRDRRDFEVDDAVHTRRAGSRRYHDGGREYDRRRERRDFDYDDAVDVSRAGKSIDFDIDDEVDVRREGRRRSNDDQRYVMRHQRRSENTDGDVSLMESRRGHDKEFDYDDQDLTERRYYSGRRSQKSARASAVQEDDSKRASSSRNTLDARHARLEDNSSSRVRWHDNVDRRTEQTSEERDRQHSVGWSNDERDAYDYNDAQFVRVRDARTGTQDVKVITEDDTRFASSSKNTSILKHSNNVDRQAAVHNDESRKSSQKIMEISEVRGNSNEQHSRAQNYHQEDRGNYIENRSSSLQSSVKMVSDSRRQVDQRSEVNQHMASLTESRKNSDKFTDATTDSSHHVTSATHLRRNYDEVNQTGIDDRSTSLHNITRVTRDKKRIVNQQVIHETDIDVQNITHADVSKICASDISVSRSSQNHSETRSDMNATSSMSFIGSARDQDEQIYQNKDCASDSAMVRDPQSYPETGVYDQVHSTSSTNIADNTKESCDQVELSKAHTNNTVIASTSDSHLQTRTDDQFWSTSAVNTIGSVKEQSDLAKIHASDANVVSSSQGFDTTNGNQVRGTSAVNWSRERQGKNDQQSIQVSSTERNDEQGSKFSESSQDSRDRLVRLEDTERLVHHNMDLILKQAGTSGIFDDKDITSLQMERTEEGSSMVNEDMTQQASIMGSNEQEVRSETTAGSSIPSSSSARQSVKVSMLESAARLDKSSTFHVGQFVDELQKGVSDADTASTKKNEKSIVEGITSSSSRSRMKGPSDEMWDVQSTTSQETFKTADKEEGSSADGATNSASQTPTNESALARKVHKSLWAYVADIIRLGWIQHGDSHDSSNKSVKKGSSSNSQSTEGWLSSQERDNDGIRKKNGNTKAQDQQLIKSHSGEQESRVVSMPKEKNLHTGTQGLQISGAGNLPRVGRSEGGLLTTSYKDDPHILGERLKQSDVGESPKGNGIDDSMPTSLDVTKGHLPEHKAATSSRITTKGSGEINTGKGMLADTSSVTISATGPGHNGDEADWVYDPSGAITPYHHPQMQAVMPHETTSAAILESPALPVGGSMRFEEKNVVQEAPEVIRTEGKDAELKRRMFQRNKQVLKETFDEWEEAYQRDADQRKADELFMREALLEAQRAADIWEVPVGAVLVQNGEIIARGCNLVEDLRDSTAHAEIVCIREASNKLKTWRLADTTLYVTLEPCAMCAGAILQARIDTVVWGAPNKLLGADGSWVRLFPGDGQTSTLDSSNQSQTAGPIHPFHPKITIRRGVLSVECSEIMQQFFQLRRKKKQKPQSPPRAHHQGHHPIKFFSKMHNMFGTILCL